ncbi:MAG: MgtC/SapB family protein [Pyrinomonadaceae bacterium]|nr:MgtC/SapB family protein [Pyrinomonadaceae bacterium]
MKQEHRQTIVLMATFLFVMIASGLVSYIQLNQPSPGANTNASPAATGTTENGEANAQKKESGGRSVISEIFGTEDSGTAASEDSWTASAAKVTLRFALAAFLSTLLALRPRRRMMGTMRNPYVAQTQILLAVVTAAMMIIVGDSTARAFGIFAAASLVNFRTNIRDPKEITVLLICLGIGLATGVGRWQVAVILTLFVLITLWTLEVFEPAQVFRPMEICVETRNVDRTHEALKQIFIRHRLNSELRELNREDEDDPLGKIVYYVNLRAVTNTDRLSEEILSADSENIDSIEWEQKESNTYLYR